MLMADQSYAPNDKNRIRSIHTTTKNHHQPFLVLLSGYLYFSCVNIVFSFLFPSTLYPNS